VAGVNGGYFAYEGAAVGAVKIDDEWIRLPWKNRTAIGWHKDGSAKIDNLQATASVEFSAGKRVEIANLNGRPVANGVCLMTPRFAATYKLREDDSALEVEGNVVVAQVTTGTTPIRTNGWTLIANGDARTKLEGITAGEKAALKVETTPAEWNEYPTILGAGPRLLRAGQVETTEVEEGFRPDVINRGRRTAIGIDGNGDFMLVVVDVAPQLSVGMTIPELAAEMQKLGAVEAINLDGGGSVALVVKNQLINSRVKEPAVANAVLVVKEAAPANEK
jgi:exopolysaccharide biosynthesis protein